MTLRTVGDLRDLLEQFDDDMPLRLAYQPSYGLTNRLDSEPRVAGGTLYLREAETSGEYAPTGVFGEPLDLDACVSCDGPAYGHRIELLGDPDHGDAICPGCAERLKVDTYLEEPSSRRQRRLRP